MTELRLRLCQRDHWNGEGDRLRDVYFSMKRRKKEGDFTSRSSCAHFAVSRPNCDGEGACTGACSAV